MQIGFQATIKHEQQQQQSQIGPMKDCVGEGKSDEEKELSKKKNTKN